MDALYFRVSSDRQTTENQFDDLVQLAQRDGVGRDWPRIRDLLSRCVMEEEHAAPSGPVTIYRVVPQIAEELARQFVYVEQGRSSKVGAKARPMFQRMRRDAAARKFERVLVWKVSRLGRNMREVIATVYELADHGVNVFPVKSQTGPITSTMGKLLWAIQAWYAEMENEERSEAVLAGQARARSAGKHLGRPRVIVDRDAVRRLRDEQRRSWGEIAKELRISAGSARRAYASRPSESGACQNYAKEAV